MRSVRPFLPLALACLLAFCLTLPTSANQRVQGWCEQGKQPVVLPGAYPSSTTQVQRSYPKCTVTVYITGTGGSLATLYSDNSSVPTPLANPFTADSFGRWFFYAADGNYDVQLSGSGFSAPSTVGAVPALNPLYIAPGAGAVPRTYTAALSDTVNVKSFGATGDGMTDDLPAFQAACAQVAAGGTVIIPPAPVYYNLDFAGATLANPKIACYIKANNVSVIGSGKASRIHIHNWSIADAVANPSTTGDGINIATVIGFGGYVYPFTGTVYNVNGGLAKDLYITGEWTDYATYFPSGVYYSAAYGVCAFNASNITMDNIVGYQIPGVLTKWSGNHGTTPTGVRVVNSNFLNVALGANFQGGTYDGAMENNLFVGASGTTAAAFETACSRCTISNNRFVGNLFNAIALSGNDNTVANNVFSATGLIAINIFNQSGCYRNALVNNQITGTGTLGSGTPVGINIATGCVDNTISGGVIKNNGWTAAGVAHGVGVYIQTNAHRTKVTGVSIGDDLVTHVQDTGVFNLAADDTSIVGNTLIGNKSQSVQIFTGARASLVGNSVDKAMSIGGVSSATSRSASNIGDTNPVIQNSTSVSGTLSSSGNTTVPSLVSGTPGSSALASLNTVTNGAFGSGTTGWTLDATWSVAGGKASNDGSSGFGLIYQAGAVAMVVGNKYMVTYTVGDYVSGTIEAVAGGSAPPGTVQHGAAGTYTDIVTSVGTDNRLYFISLHCICSITNISAVLLNTGDGVFAGTSKAADFAPLSAAPGISGCSSATIVGNDHYGVVTAGGTSCDAVLTFGFTAKTGWSCSINNETHPGSTNLVGQASSTTATSTWAGTTVSSDKLSYVCGPY